jgi:hypothetical protein
MKTMAEMNELHFETIDRNKDINMQRNKIKYLEDRIATLERTLESHAKILARFQMTEDKEQPLILTKEMEINNAE